MDDPRTKISLLEFKNQTYVKVGGVLVHPNTSSKLVGRSASALFQKHDNIDFELNGCGTVSLLEYRGKHFGVCTRHQVVGCNPQDICLMSDKRLEGTDRPLLVTSSGCNEFRTTSDSDEYDLIVYNFSEPVKSGSVPREWFFGLSQGSVIKNGEEVVMVAVHGFSFSDQQYNLSDDLDENVRLAHVHSVKRELLCEYMGNSYEDKVFNIQTISTETLSLDGFSGAPTFAIVGNPGNYRMCFSGVVVRGGNRQMHAIKALTVLRLLEAASSTYD